MPSNQNMSADSNDSIEVSNQLTVRRPKQTDAMPVTEDDWQLLKIKVERIATKDSWFLPVGTTLIGAGIGAIISAFSITPTPQQEKLIMVLYAIGGGLFLAGVAFSFCHFKIGEQIASQKQDALDEMQRIERLYEAAVSKRLPTKEALPRPLETDLVKG